MSIQKKRNVSLILTTVFFGLFVLFTILIKTVDVRKIGESEVFVGFASFNENVFRKLGTNLVWDKVTNLLFVMCLTLAVCFAGVGVFELIKNKSLKKVNSGIVALGCTYVLIALCYLFFEIVIINYRPVLVDGKLEASYPSSHVFISLSVIWSAIIFILGAIKNKLLKAGVIGLGSVVSVIAIVGRLLSGQHWGTDVVGGILLAMFIVSVFYLLNLILKEKLTENFALIDNITIASPKKQKLAGDLQSKNSDAKLKSENAEDKTV